MPSEPKRILTTDQWVKIALTLFLAGSAWTRFEYKMDQSAVEIKGIFEKYTIQNEADKALINFKHEELKDKVQAQSVTLSNISDFIKPENVQIKKQKYR